MYQFPWNWKCGWVDWWDRRNYFIYSHFTPNDPYFLGTPGKEVDKMVKTFKKQHKSATQKPVKKQNQMSHAYTRLCAEHDWVS